MQLVLHAGAHFTEEERLLRCLLRNTDDFSRRGVVVPGPGKYRKLLKDTMAALQDAAPSPDARDILMDVILNDENADRMILSHMFLFGAPRGVVRDGMMYKDAPQRMAQLAALFAQDDIELFLALRNPGTFLPALFEQSPQDDMHSFLREANPFEIKWSHTLSAIREAAPTVKITAWCFEDMPMIWAQIIRDMVGIQDNDKIVGGFDLLSDIMSKEGMTRFRAYLKSHPSLSEIQKRQVISAFLAKFAIDEEIEEELNAPGWTEGDIDTLTQIYEEDLNYIALIPGVRFITA